MKTRRELLLSAVAGLIAAAAAGLPEKSGPLEVTYYYLPG